ncbi:MAG: hypothetical protein AABY22_00800, partial [Nanoarchaeota archaeon]
IGLEEEAVGEIKKKYYVKVFLEVDRNLERETEGLDVNHNLPFSGGYWCSGESVETFFKELKEYISRPFGKVIIQNEGTKRAEISSYNVNQIGYKIRDTEISFDDIDFTIGELAENKLKEKGIDFEKEFKKILSGQVITNRQKDVDN